MERVDLGIVDDLGTKKTRVKRKASVSSRRPVKLDRHKNSPIFTRLAKLGLASALLGLLIFGVYSYLPQIKSYWSSLNQGPQVVMSFLKEQPQNLKQDDGVTNVLLLGIDKRSVIPYSYTTNDGEIEKNGFLSDTMVVVSYNHNDNSVVMLSLPRDLWVELPAFDNVYKQSTKINAAYAFGDMYGYEGGGMALSREVVSNILDIPIHYAVRVDFDGFRQAIDLVGGIDVEVENTFDDWAYPREGYENAPLSERYLHLHFDVGMQHMDGETALQFARSRQGTNGEGSDFARARRQQKVISAFQTEAKNMNLIEGISKISELYDLFGETVQTDVQLDEVLLVYKASQKVNLEEMTTHVLDNGFDESSVLYHPDESLFGGAWILLPKNNDWTIVQDYVQKIFYLERMPLPEETTLPTEESDSTT